jgi:uncharacterized protein
MNNQLIIFAKNPILGQVKTRLAATVGNKKALEVYQQLLAHTNKISASINAKKSVYYSEFIEQEDQWKSSIYDKKLQEGDDLGVRMKNAFQQHPKRKAVLIGTDCPGLSATIIDQAFEALSFVDVVIGPAEDGGYYLIGMNQLEESLFQDVTWSSSEVLNETVNKINKKKLSFLLLKTLSDVDTEKDLNQL